MTDFISDYWYATTIKNLKS